jgi:hypothetical protein
MCEGVCEKMKINDDVRLLRGWANHEEARWSKGGQLLYCGEVSFLGTPPSPPPPPKATNGSGNVYEGWQLFNEGLLALFHSRGKEGWRY